MLCKFLRVFVLLAGCVVSIGVHAMDVSDPGDPALSVSSTPPAHDTGVGTHGDPALSVSSHPNHPMQGGDPALSASSNPAAKIKKGDPALSVSSAPALTPAACKALIKHTPDANVAYQPGVDAHGNAVAPADVLTGAAPMQLPKTFHIPLTLQLAKVLNLNSSQYPFSELGNSTEVPLGTFTVSGDHVLFNGQPISDEQQSNLQVLCMKENGK